MSGRRIADFALIILVFVAAGPLIGLGVVALLSYVGVAISHGVADAWSVPAFMLLYGWLFAHLMGAVPALVAGAIVAVYARWRGRVPLFVGAIAGLVSAVCLGVVSHYGISIGRAPETPDGSVIAIWLATHVVAAIACTHLTRRWQQ